MTLTPEQRDAEMKLDEAVADALRSGMSKEMVAEFVSDFLRSWDEEA